MKSLTLLVVSGLLGLWSMPALAGPVEIEKTGEGYRLLVDGEPYEVKGVGGTADKQLLVACGGNTFRTWGIGPQTQAVLDEAESLGLKVVVGIWLGHERHGFDYDDPQQIQEQFDAARDAVVKYKDHPALLMWSVGNEVEVGMEGASREKMWKAINDIGAMIKQIDGDHPTMTVTADLGGDSVEALRDRCPSIDIHGINSYGGAASITERYHEAGGTKPYMLTEFGPLGIWEIGKNDIGAYVEATSTEKAKIYREVAHKLAADKQLCLGSFAFVWGYKQEVTSTWFGMLLPDDTRLASVDVMTEIWTGKPPANRVPKIDSFELDALRVEPGGTVTAKVSLSDPEGDPLDVQWLLVAEGKEFKTGGDDEDVPDSFPDAVIESDSRHAVVRLPEAPGLYRVFMYARDGQGGGATANLPVLVTANAKTSAEGPASGSGSDEPVLVVYGDGMAAPPFAASGYMGMADAITMNEQSHDNPYSGETCLAVSYRKAGDWGGVVWQNPANDWGDLPGGHDVKDAAALSFWARGQSGGEVVKFGFGLLGQDKKYSDSATGEIQVTLNTDWTQYTIDTAGQDLSHIKTGFYWSLAGQGRPVQFFLDDIQYQATASQPTPAFSNTEPE